MARRVDMITLSNPQKKSNGFLTYDFYAAQTGVFPYFDWNTGKIVYELKHPDDLLKDEVLVQLQNLPITEDHPYELVTTDNAKEYVKGMTNNNASIEGNKLKGQGTVFDAALIGKILNRDKMGCSLGFECEIVDEAGEYEGMHYDRRQTNFILNHLAMVKEGRCGPDCGAILDNKEFDGAVQIRLDEVEKYKTFRKEGMTMKLVLDGKEYDVPQEVAARVDSLSTKVEELTKENGKLQGKLDGKEDEINQLKNQNEELKKKQLSDEAIDKAVKERLELVNNAKEILGDAYEFTGKSARQIKVDCIKKVSGDEFKEDGKSDEYIDARFDTILDFAKGGEFASVGDNNLKFKGDSNYTKDINDMRQKRLNMRK